MSTNHTPGFGAVLRHWREARRYSQLDLALQADVSSKHVSFLETGRNQPSRAMILRLANAMDLPLRDRNLMLSAAGFADVYTETTLNSPELGKVEEALARILEMHEPYPAIVVDANWNIVKQNRGSSALLQLFVHDPGEVSGNAFELLFSKEGLQPYVRNWKNLSSTLLLRLFRETLSASSGPEKRALFDKITAMPSAPANWQELASGLPGGPTLDLELENDKLRCRFFTTVTTFGTPQDVTLQELRIESYFPSDDTTRALCETWAT